MTTPTDHLRSCLARRWIHSREEDSGATRAYRPEGSALPPSRWPRHIIEFREDGRFVSRSAGPADARVSREGRWELAEPGLLALHWASGDDQANLQIEACDKDLLKVTVVGGSIE